MEEDFDDYLIPNENNDIQQKNQIETQIEIKKRIRLKDAVENVLKQYRANNKIEQTITDAILFANYKDKVRNKRKSSLNIAMTEIKQQEIKIKRKSKIQNFQTQLTKLSSTTNKSSQNIIKSQLSNLFIHKHGKVSDIIQKEENISQFDKNYQKDYFQNILGDQDQDLNSKLQQMYLQKDKLEDKSDIRAFALYYQQHFKTFYRSKVLKQLQYHKLPVRQIRFSPNGQMFASCCEGGNLKLWDFKTLNMIQSLEKQKTKFLCLRFTYDNQKILVGCDDCSVKVWKLNNFILEETLFNHSEQVNTIDVLNSYFASGSDDCQIQIVSFDDFQVKYTLDGHLSGVTCLDHTSDQKILISAGQDAKINIWDADKKFILSYTLLGHRSTINCIITFESKLYSSSQDKKIKIWDLNLNQCVKSLEYEFEVKEVSISYDHSLMLGACDDGSIRLWNLTNFNNEQTFIQHEECVNTVQYSPDMSIFVSASDDTQVNVWHASTYQISNFFVPNNICVRSIIFFRKKDLFLIGGEDGSVQSWNYEFNCTNTQTYHVVPVTGLSLSLSEEYFVSSSIYDPIIILWRTINHKQYKKLINPSGFTITIAFLNNDKFLIGQSSGILDVWDIKDSSPKIMRDNHMKVINCLSICQDLQYFITGSSDGKIGIWKTEQFELQQYLIGHLGKVVHLFLLKSNDENKIISGDNLGYIIIWNFWNYQCEYKFKAFDKERIVSLCQLSDVNCFIAASESNVIKIWNLQNFEEEIKIAPSKNDKMFKFNLFSNGKLILTTALNNQIHCRYVNDIQYLNTQRIFANIQTIHPSILINSDQFNPCVNNQFNYFKQIIKNPNYLQINNFTYHSLS